MTYRRPRTTRANRIKATRRQALTLVETAAVVVVLCAVLAVIVPALGETRRRGKDAVCLQNLHRIAQASHVYAGRDPAGFMIPFARSAVLFGGSLRFSQLGVYGYGGKSGVGNDDGSSDIRLSLFGPAGELAAHDRQLNQILFRNDFADLGPRPGGLGNKWRPDAELNLDVYHCPADSGYTGLHVNDGWRLSGLSSFDHFGASYAANVMWVRSASFSSSVASNSPYVRSLSRIVNPARTVAYIENNGRSAWRAAPDPCPLYDGLDGTCGGWHGKDWTFNSAFVDGHVSTEFMRGYRSEPIAHAPPLADDVSCITIRGDDWQIDTLPSPLVTVAVFYDDQGERIP